MGQPITPAQAIIEAAQRHQAARDAAKAVSAEIAAERAKAATSSAAPNTTGK